MRRNIVRFLLRNKVVEFVAPDWWLNFSLATQSGYLALF